MAIIEVRYISEFLGVYPYFCTCSQVLESLRNAYHSPKLPKEVGKAVESEYIEKIERRVLFVLTKWLQNYPRQFYDASTIQELRGFIEQLKDCPEKTVIERLYNTVSQR